MVVNYNGRGNFGVQERLEKFKARLEEHQRALQKEETVATLSSTLSTVKNIQEYLDNLIFPSARSNNSPTPSHRSRSVSAKHGVEQESDLGFGFSKSK